INFANMVVNPNGSIPAFTTIEEAYMRLMLYTDSSAFTQPLAAKINIVAGDYSTYLFSQENVSTNPDLSIEFKGIGEVNIEFSEPFELVNTDLILNNLNFTQDENSIVVGYIEDSNITIRDCEFEGYGSSTTPYENTSGGAIRFLNDSTNPSTGTCNFVIENCNFDGLCVNYGGTLVVPETDSPLKDGLGGAIAIDARSTNGFELNLEINDCTFTDNSANGGAALALLGLKDIIVSGCTFDANILNAPALQYSYNYTSDGAICLFIDNDIIDFNHNLVVENTNIDGTTTQHSNDYMIYSYQTSTHNVTDVMNMINNTFYHNNRLRGTKWDGDEINYLNNIFSNNIQTITTSDEIALLSIPSESSATIRVSNNLYYNTPVQTTSPYLCNYSSTINSEEDFTEYPPNLDANYVPIWDATTKSVCINNGTPDLDEDGISWLTDADDKDEAGTQMDIGAKTYLNNIKQNIFTLDNDEVKYFSVPAVFNPASTTHSFNTWDNVFNEFYDNDLINHYDFEQIKWKWNGNNVLIYPSGSYSSYRICSQYGYKIKYDETATSFTLPFEYDGFLPGNSLNAGMYLSDLSRYTTKLYILEPEANEPNCSQSGTTGVWEREIYLGYYLEGSLNPFDALRPIIDDITAIYAEDWGMSRLPIVDYEYQTGDEPHDAYTDNWLGFNESDGNIAINYGDMVVVKYIGTSNAEFPWGGLNPNPPYTDQYKRPMATHFDYEEQLDYLPIFVEIDMDEYEDGEKPVEVAVFVDGTCKGAAVIEEKNVQLNAYVLTDSTAAVNDVTFQFWFPSKGASKTVQQYQVYNPKNGKFEDSIANIIDFADFLKVSISSKDMNAGVEIPRVTALNGNFPNPFNPTTTIMFDVAKDGNTKLEIFNIRGQKVKTLVNEEITAGSYNIQWHGDDDNNKSLASGVYFSRLTTSGKALTKKMLLLK
ncbi:MAG: T9SS type A sorting domain-containing protein, partial [Candidatus Cloacimonetes bacterium]|nr:T9SS type A sorting domain-containing protein [Candidatus Cloacimonadota bacterium]